MEQSNPFRKFLCIQHILSSWSVICHYHLEYHQILSLLNWKTITKSLSRSKVLGAEIFCMVLFILIYLKQFKLTRSEKKKKDDKTEFLSRSRLKGLIPRHCWKKNIIKYPYCYSGLMLGQEGTQYSTIEQLVVKVPSGSNQSVGTFLLPVGCSRFSRSL